MNLCSDLASSPAGSLKRLIFSYAGLHRDLAVLRSPSKISSSSEVEGPSGTSSAAPATGLSISISSEMRPITRAPVAPIRMRPP